MVIMDRVIGRAGGSPAAEGQPSLRTQIASLDWPGLEASLWSRGLAETPPVVAQDVCRALASLYGDDERFRSRVDMARHRFGEGEYKYFAAPLPGLVQALREALYEPLAAVANRWMEALGQSERYPDALDAFLDRCRAAGQSKPTPLVLRYAKGGYNCLHQDLYGEVAFPLQVMVPLDRHDLDYTGGEFVLVEQRPRAQSVAEVIRPEQGALVIFTTRIRPARGTRGYHRVNVRHGVSRVRTGTRRALGIIFHDAR